MSLESPSPARTPRGAVWFVAFLVPFAALAVHHWGWSPSASSGDYAQYLLHAKALVEGRPYAETGYIVHPDAWSIGPPAYPPGFPLTLAPIVTVVGVHSALFRVLMLASMVAMALFAWRRLARDVLPWQAAAGAGFAAFAIEARGGTLAPISDVGFAALMWGTVLAVDATVQWSWRRILLVTALGGAALAFRITGVAVVGAFALYALATWPRHRGRAAIPAAIWALCALVVLAMGAVHLGDLTTLLAGYRGLDVQVSMLRQYRWSLFEMVLYPTTSSAVNLVYHVTAALIVVAGLAVMARRSRWSFLTVACVVYVAMIIVAPVGDPRYLWPLYPVGACALAVGLTRLLELLLRWWPSLPASRLGPATLVAVLLAALYTETSRPRPESLVDRPDAKALFAWLRQTSRTTAMRIAFSNPRVVTLETGVPGMGNVQRRAAGQLLAYAEKNITHLIWQSEERSDCLQRIANSLPRLYPERFALDYENAGFRVYRVLPGAVPPADSTTRLSWRDMNLC